MAPQMDMKMSKQIPEITLNAENFYKASIDKKLSTIRLGNKDISPGPAFLVNDENQTKILVDIWFVNHCLLSDLELNDARLDGFDTMEDLKAELRRCYQGLLQDREVCTQVLFNVVEEARVA